MAEPRLLTPEEITRRLTETGYATPERVAHQRRGDSQHWTFQLSRFQYWIAYHRRDDGPAVISAAMTSALGGNDLRDGPATLETWTAILEQIIACEMFGVPVIPEPVNLFSLEQLDA